MTNPHAYGNERKHVGQGPGKLTPSGHESGPAAHLRPASALLVERGRREEQRRWRVRLLLLALH